MITAVIDTHAIIWWLYNDPRLSDPARQFLRAAGEAGHKIAISSITLIEIVYLIEKQRISIETLSLIARMVQASNGIFEEAPVNLEIARSLNVVEIARVPDMPDRIIAATAIHLNVPVISKDGKIQLSGLATIW